MAIELKSLAAQSHRTLSFQEPEKPIAKNKAKLNRVQTIAASHQDDEVQLRRKPNYRRADSVAAIEELLECAICSNRLRNAKMLTCQHTFCTDCLKRIVRTSRETIKNGGGDAQIIECPVCKYRSVITDVDQLPANLYIDNLIGVLECQPPEVTAVDHATSAPPPRPATVMTRTCHVCKTVCAEHAVVTCQHCSMNFCAVCYPKHGDELLQRLPEFLHQLRDQEMRLEFEQTDYSRHCTQLVEEIKDGFAARVNELKKIENNLVEEVNTLLDAGAMEIDEIAGKIKLLKADIDRSPETKPQNKVQNYMSYHQQISQIADGISQLAANYKRFNAASLKLETPSFSGDTNDSMIYAELTAAQVTSPDLLIAYYKTHRFQPKAVYTKFQKPTGLHACPWRPKHVYVCSMKIVYLYDTALARIVQRYAHDSMSCPQGITTNATLGEIYVSDKWKDCVHVFGKDGAYLRRLSPEVLSNPHGLALSAGGDLLLCDTGNDRVLIMDPTSGKVKGAVGMEDGITELAMPMDVATDAEGRMIVVADTGNNRVKIFDGATLKRLNVIGSFGKQKEQFRDAEVVHVDNGGNILVGDSGNRRLQVFDAMGKLVRCTGAGEFKVTCISGICTTIAAEIVVTDFKTKTLITY